METADRTKLLPRLMVTLLGSLITSGCSFSNGIMKTYPAAEDFEVSSLASAKKIRVHLWASNNSVVGGTTNTGNSIGPSIPELTAEVWCITRNKTNITEPIPQGCKYITLIESAQDKENDVSGVTDFFKACDDEAASPPICKTARNRLHSYLMKIAKKNCSTYLQDVFTVKTTADGTSGFLKDMLSGGAITGAASGSPPVAGGLALANLLVGSYDKVNHSLFMGETAPVLVLAIEAAQEIYRTDKSNSCSEVNLDGTSSYGNCDVHKVFSFIQGYSDQCSLKAGIAVLNAAVGVKNVKEVSERAKITAEEAKDAAKKASAAAELAVLRSASALSGADKNGLNISIKAIEDDQKKSVDRIAELESALKVLQERNVLQNQ